MPVSFTIPNFEEQFKTVTHPIVVNDLPYTTEEERQRLVSLLLTVCESDVLSTTPQCTCGHLQHGYNFGRLCPICKTNVTYPAEGAIDMRIWVRVPDGVRGFISPVAWVQIGLMLNRRGFNLLNWLVNPKVKVPRSVSKEITNRINYFYSINWQRSLNYFIDNFETVLQAAEI